MKLDPFLILCKLIVLILKTATFMLLWNDVVGPALDMPAIGVGVAVAIVMMVMMFQPSKMIVKPVGASESELSDAQYLQEFTDAGVAGAILGTLSIVHYLS